MVAPKCPGTEVREEYKRGFGVPTLIAVHKENDPNGDGLEIAKAYAAATGGDRAGVLESSFVAEVKSDLMGEQTILCGMLQTGSLLCFDKMVAEGIERGYASKLVQFGWETITEALKQGGITLMMDRLSNPAKIKAFELADELRGLMRPLFKKHQDDIITGVFSDDDDEGLGRRRQEPARLARRHQRHRLRADRRRLGEDQRAGVLRPRRADGRHGQGRRGARVRVHGRSRHEARVRLLRVAPRDAPHRQPHLAQEAVRDEQGHQRHGRVRLLPVQPRRVPLLKEFMAKQETDVIGKAFAPGSQQVDNRRLLAVNQAIEAHPVEKVGATLRGYMTAMKQIAVGG